MVEMGFEYDPSTAGSSVRFIPKDQRDKPITFHKRMSGGTLFQPMLIITVAHPDPTIQPVMLKDFAKKLQRHYGWTQEDIVAAS